MMNGKKSGGIFLLEKGAEEEYLFQGVAIETE